MTDKNLPYEVTFTLRQDGLDGDIQAFLSFSHPPTSFPTDDLVPESYERMLAIAQFYLEETGFVDSNGNIIQRDDYTEAVFVEAAKPSRLN